MESAVVPGTLYVVATPIGNLGDITHRAISVLSEVDLIAAEDTRTTKVLLDRYGISKGMISYHSHNERRRAEELVGKLKSGLSIALVSDAGTPGISDPAHQVIKQAIAEGIGVVPIPGASALLCALIVSGFPTNKFVFEGFLPLKKGRRSSLESLKSEERTVILYESPHRIERTLREMLEILGDREISLARELTKKFEEVARGRISQVLGALTGRKARGEYVIVLSGSQGS